MMSDPELTSPPSNNVLILVIHMSCYDQGYHYSSIVLDAEQHSVHVFDTLGCWTDRKAKQLLASLWPNGNSRRRRGPRL
jgi:hypothetical protein